MDIPQLQAELAAKADEAWPTWPTRRPSTALNGPWTSPRHRRQCRQVVRKGHRCNGSVFDGEARRAKDLDVGMPLG